MRIKTTKDTIIFSKISNESELESINTCVTEANCAVKFEDFSSKVVVSGTKENLNKFIELWNNQ